MFILVCGIIGVCVAILQIWAAKTLFTVRSGRKVVAEMIYNLVGDPEIIDEKDKTPDNQSIQSEESFASIYGLGYNKEHQWSLAGKKPTPKKEPTVRFFLQQELADSKVEELTETKVEELADSKVEEIADSKAEEIADSMVGELADFMLEEVISMI